ncbi:MAG: ABC transporter permease [Acidobacteria bacterium]|nr:ABC transporter permease [Acidobacteriota bacterium]
MHWFSGLALRLRGLLWRRRLDRDLEAEVQFHLVMRQRENEQAGMPPEEAWRAAHRSFGSETAVKETGRDLFGFAGLERSCQDIRHGWRLLLKSPVVTLVAVSSLALGIGGNTAMFSVIHAVLLQPLPFSDADKLVTIWGADLTRGRSRQMVAFADVLDWQRQTRLFEQVAAAGGGAAEATLLVNETPELVRWQYVSPNLLNLLGVKPVLGRDVKDPGMYRASRGILLSYDFWRRRFGSDPSVISRPVTLNGRPVMIAGVMPRGFQIFSGGQGTEVWQALDPENADQRARAIPWLLGVGRLAPGVTLSQAGAELSGIAAQLEQAYPATNKGRGVLVEPVSAVRSGLQEVLLPLAGAVVFVLLLACANVANILLARSSTRKKELALRAALGAGRGRLMRQLLTEGLLLAVIGGLAGLGVAWLGVRLFQALAPAWFPRYVDIVLDAPVLIFTLAVSLIAGILAGFAPAVQGSRTNLNDSLKEGTHASSARRRTRTRAALVATQVALAVVLLAGTGLMINTLLRLLNVNVGFEPSKLITLQIDFSGEQYVELIKSRENAVRRLHPRVEIAYDRILERVRGIPGVESATLATWVPQAGNNRGPRARRFNIIGRTAPSQALAPFAFYNMVGPDYFTTMRIPLLRGRVISSSDTQSGSWVVAINEAAAKRFWPNEDPLGQVITVRTVGSAESERPREIVGIVGDIRQMSLAREAAPEIYAAYAQQPPVYGDGWQALLHRNLLVRAVGDPEEILGAVRKEVASIDRGQPVYGLKTMSEIILANAAPWRFYVNLLSIFGAIALFLAAIGIYAVISYTISERTYEFGIRLALGGKPGHICRLVFRDGLLLVAVGLGAGVAAALFLTPLIRAFLYGVKPHDPFTLACAALALLIVASLAILLPARRAMRTDPQTALRAQ